MIARAQSQLQQAATTTLPQEAQLAALDRQSQQFADAERTQSGYRLLRERYDPDELDRSLQSIGAIADPAQQRAGFTQLQAGYAGFAFNPDLARRIDAQFAAFEPVLQRREQASLRAAISAGRYAPTLADARQLYPGRKINTFADPGSGAIVFVPDKVTDPDLDAEAVQVVENAFRHALAIGSRSHLEAALDDPAFRQVSRIPGNRASAVFGQKLAELYAPRQPVVSEPPEVAQPLPTIAARPVQTGQNGAPPAHTPVPYSGVPYGANFNTPFGPGTATHRPDGDRLSAESYFPKWFVELATPKPYPELDEIAELLAKPGRYFDPTSVWENPRVVDPHKRKSSYKITEFKEPFMVTVRDGLIYSVIGGVEKRRTPSSKGTSVDGVRPTSIAPDVEPRQTPPAKATASDEAPPAGGTLLYGEKQKTSPAKGAPAAGVYPRVSGPRSPARNGQIIGGVQAGVGALSSLMEGQLQSTNNLSRFAFLHNPSDGTWHVKDISGGHNGSWVLPEAQAREIIKGIFANYGRKPP